MLGILLQFVNNNLVNRETAAGILLILLVVLMTCVFSTLDNAVTLVHASGTVDIGQWSRILLTFYVSAGFFAVFFTVGFMEISRYMKIPELWAGLGRAVNNITAAVIANGSLMLLASGSSMITNITVLILFVAVSIVTAAFAFQRKVITDKPAEITDKDLDQKAKLQDFSKSCSFTPRETEVFDQLVNTEDSIQTIAESLCISRRTIERYISSIYEKTGVKARVGLIRIYNEK